LCIYLVLKCYPFPHCGSVSGATSLTLLQVLEDLLIRDTERFGLEFGPALNLACGVPPLGLISHCLRLISLPFFS
jgi:hypothetical protein